MAKYTIRILNYSFTISSDDDKNYMDNIAAKVERRVKRLSDEMPSRNMTEVALFVAMDYCDQYMKSVGDGSNLRGQIKDYLQESGFARKQLEEAKKENELLRAEVEALRKRLSSKETASADEPEKVVSKKLKKAPVSDEKPSETVEAKPSKKTKKTPVIEDRTPQKSEASSESAPVQGFFSEDAFAESADATAEIMSFFEQKAFEEDDE